CCLNAARPPQRGGRHGMALVVHEAGRRRIVDDLLQLGGRQTEVQRHEDCAQPGTGEQRGQLQRVVQTQPGQAVASPQTLRGQRPGQPFHPLPEGRRVEHLGGHAGVPGQSQATAGGSLQQGADQRR
ncbi:hypothetical protein RZS08_51920, partial [Arthrospira platensis SPKY1]|nr:hypothetical protein [Arthrospira platensis SPKY1]